MAARLSALRAGRTLPLGFFIFKDFWYSFLLEAESTPGRAIVRPEGLGQFNSIQYIYIYISFSTIIDMATVCHVDLR
jgi:hypothetical protein